MTVLPGSGSVLPLVDTFVFGGSLAIAAQVNIDVLWRATSDPVEQGSKGAAVDPTSPAAFTGHFAEASCSGRVSGVETGFHSKLASSRQAFFAEMGQERNGVFLS